ncbi:hypothetical protein COV93_00130 [Candidatus Woesearchaeota archaeon CG11_big_fil_rev_8_21_14_0_20_43_8]|nr:MAG: hypothetical protein COV93_00130 [Candidatus Woesearchaeota archaeon CG11_big_fil_rev_8_21_14_0_20_43_8]PIO05250.1 MAG: hypothetical protein COT47_05555 [Candidatus Woesearchaeota archaeon CG08_land_8_20_14_0_20_43_7]
MTKTQVKIMQMLTANITGSFSLTDISRQLKLQYQAAHRAIKPLVKDRYIAADNKRYSLNYKMHHQELAYVESLRSKELLQKPRNSTLSLFIADTIKRIKEDNFILIVFGSTVTENKPRDTDILLIVDDIHKTETLEKQLGVIANMFILKFDIHVISHESVYDMLRDRGETNLINEVLDKHIITYGAETFYRLLAKGRPYKNAG